MLEEIKTLLARAIADAFCIHPDEAARFSQGFAARLAERFGGGRHYLAATDRRARDAAIQRDYDGANVDALCERHGVSRATVYRVVGRAAF
jgi:Mor family transcriptional regulator